MARISAGCCPPRTNSAVVDRPRPRTFGHSISAGIPAIIQSAELRTQPGMPAETQARKSGILSGLELAVLVVAGGVILSVGALFVYAVVSPSARFRTEPQSPLRGPGHACVYCRSTVTRRIGQEPRYDDDGFALVSAFECMRCGLPFWSVDRSPAGQRLR